jgi:hypothetical protein
MSILRQGPRGRFRRPGFECANQGGAHWLRRLKVLSTISGLPTTGPWRLQLTPPELMIRQASEFTTLPLACREFQRAWATWRSDSAPHTCCSSAWKKQWTNYELDRLNAGCEGGRPSNAPTRQEKQIATTCPLAQPAAVSPARACRVNRSDGKIRRTRTTRDPRPRCDPRRLIALAFVPPDRDWTNRGGATAS